MRAAIVGCGKMADQHALQIRKIRGATLVAACDAEPLMAKQMAEQEISVRTLAARASVSPTIVQGIKSGKRKNIEYTTLKALTLALGFKIMFKRTHTAKV